MKSRRSVSLLDPDTEVRGAVQLLLDTRSWDGDSLLPF